MDAGAVQAYLDQGLLGVTIVVLAGAMVFCVRHIIVLYGRIDGIRKDQINDTRIALEAVSKSTDNLNSAEERMVANTEATKELLAVTRSMMNRGQV